MGDVSAERRRFFREILALGVDGVERAAREVGRRLGDAVEQARKAPGEAPGSADDLKPPHEGRIPRQARR
jgi:hypothetical protein